VPDAAAVEDRLAEAIANLTGEIQQVPSAVSAIKVAGERSYARVRRGGEVDLPARPVTVSRFEVMAVRPALAALEDGRKLPVLDVDVEVDVSSGTYVRALARDLGTALGTGGHLTALRRTRVGRFQLDQTQTLEALTATFEREGADGIRLMPLADAAACQLPVHRVSSEEARLLGHGQRIASGEEHAEAVAAIDPDGRLVAVLDESRSQARAKVVFVAG
jgi:tRNA pseudouridine55 synthase